MNIRNATEHARLTLQSDYEPDARCQCPHCVPSRLHREWVGPYVHTAPHPDDRSEQALTNEHAACCGRPADYCRDHPCAGRKRA